MSRNHPFTRLMLLFSGASPCRTSRAGSALGEATMEKTRMRKFVLALAVSAAFATTAMAEDFSGPYIGTGVTLDNVQASGDLEGLGVSGLGATAFAGYDISLGTSAFVGLEANADLNTADVEDVEADWGW